MEGRILNERTGKMISGGAAQLHIIKKNGGWDAHHKKIAERAAELAVKEMIQEFSKFNSRPNLKLVK